MIDIFSTDYAFAALRSDGSVITWGTGKGGNYSGRGQYGSDSSLVDFDGPNNDLTVKNIFSLNGTFYALRSDNSAVYWGGYEGNADEWDENLMK